MRVSKKGTPSPLESGYFTAIDSCSIKTLADRRRHAASDKH